MSAGRPSKYTPELLEKAREYIENHIKYGDVVPSHAGLATEIGITRATLYDWAKDPEKAEFSYILDECNRKQERLLLSGALVGDMNANIAKLMLGKHGYSEKHQQEITGADGGAVKTESTVTWTVQPVKPIDESDA